MNQLENIKKKVIELLDDFSTELNLYNLYNDLKSSKTTKWTPSERTKFLLKIYRLDPLISAINKIIKKYKEHLSRMKKEALKSTQIRFKIKPLNFAVLIWNYAMKIGEKVDWINMENLLNWFSEKLNRKGLLDYFEFKLYEAPMAETLRLTRNKYKKTKYEHLSKTVYNNLFKKESNLLKEKFPKPLDELNEYIKWEDKNLEHIKKLADITVLGLWFSQS